MEKLIIEAEIREIHGRKTDALRNEGKTPAVVYGFNTEPINITVDRNAAEKLYREAGDSSVIDLKVGGKEYNVLIQDIQRDVLTGFIIHVDFRSLDMTKTVETTISLIFVGEAPAVKEMGGTLVTASEEIEVRALPSKLVHEIEVNIGSLKTFDDAIRVSDLEIPEGIEVLTNAQATIASVTSPRTAEEMEALDNAVEGDVGAVEVTTEKKVDENKK